MSAQIVFERAPVGAIISWTDGKPRPPANATEALSVWKEHNGYGQLVNKSVKPVMGQAIEPGGFKVLVLDDAMRADHDNRQMHSFSADSDLAFRIIERPRTGACRILDRVGDDAELAHLASSRLHAQTWVDNLGSRHMVIEEVTADEIAADHIEGRAAA